MEHMKDETALKYIKINFLEHFENETILPIQSILPPFIVHSNCITHNQAVVN